MARRKPLLVNVRGTCGSGKSHIVHAVRRERGMMEPVFAPGRRRPVGYFEGNLFVAGHYEIAIGGLDTFRTLDDAYEAIDKYHDGRSVLCEGKAQNRDVEYLTGRLHTFRVVCVCLTTSIEQAVASVRKRGHNISEQIIARTHRKCDRDADALEGAGVKVHRLDRASAMDTVRELLR